jgi:hypothetical protein
VVVSAEEPFDFGACSVQGLLGSGRLRLLRQEREWHRRRYTGRSSGSAAGAAAMDFEERVQRMMAALGAAPPPAQPDGVQAAAPDVKQQPQPDDAAPGDAAAAWHLDTFQGFKAGRADAASDDEAEGAVPASLPGAAGSDEDEEEYARHASAAFCRCEGLCGGGAPGLQQLFAWGREARPPAAMYTLVWGKGAGLQ